MSEATTVEKTPSQEPEATQQATTPAPGASANETNHGGSTGNAVPSGGRESGEDHGEPNVSWQDIKSVQNLIERCLQKFMTQTEIIAALQVPGGSREARSPTASSRCRCGVLAARSDLVDKCKLATLKRKFPLWRFSDAGCLFRRSRPGFHITP